ncbi:MAG: DUF4105 domain-containing protein [Trichlorobacter sp.]|nr:DUF4105 domain-containing protein [Trichlorobacter sp.]
MLLSTVINNIFNNQIKKSGFIAVFFYFTLPYYADIAIADDNIAENLYQKAISEELHKEPAWNALIHFGNAKANITDKSFMLSYPDTSSKLELERTIKYLYSDDNSSVCRFPARYYWLRSRLSTAPELPLDVCHEITEFKEHAPVTDIYLAFASENITSPASMLGHTFLRLTGYDAQNNEVSHAVSFYIDASTWNLPQLFIESMVTGKKGFFALTPYAEKLKEYVIDEQRQVWEYKLDLDEQQKQLIRLHLLELKNTEMIYLFQSYNCATVINFILQLTGTNTTTNKLFIMPKDVIKNAYKAGIISDTKVIVPSRLIIRELQHEVSDQELEQIKHSVETGNVDFVSNMPDNDKDFIKLELAAAYNQYLNLQNKTTDDIFDTNVENIKVARNNIFTNKNISFNRKQNPIKTSANSQLSFATIIDDGKPAMTITFLPASHTLIDDNRTYGNESELQLFSPTLKIPLSGKTPFIDRFAVYAIQNLLPRDVFTGGISTKLFIGYDQIKNRYLEHHHALSANGALGITERLTDDIDLYLLGGGGVNYARSGFSAYLTSELGLVVREIWDMKSMISGASTTYATSKQFSYGTVNFRQAKYMDNNHTIAFEYSRDFNTRKSVDQFVLSIKKIF